MAAISSGLVLRRLSKLILTVSAYTMGSEVVNQYTTLLGVVNGGYELDPTARYLFSTIGLGGETIAVFSIPFFVILVSYFAGVKWRPSTVWKNRVRLVIVGICLFVLVLLAISTTCATINDFESLYARHLV